MLVALAASGLSAVGLLSMALLGDWGRRRGPYFSAFSVGVLGAAVLLHILLEAIFISPTAWRSGAAILLFLALVRAVWRLFRPRQDGEDPLPYGVAAAVAIGFHSFIDGLIYATSFHDHVFTGAVTSLGLLLHELPEGVIAYFVLRDAGASRFASVVGAFLAASVTTAAGAMAAVPLLSVFPNLPTGAMLAATAGVLTYVIAFHLAPHARPALHRGGYVAMAAGVLVATAAVSLQHI